MTITKDEARDHLRTRGLRATAPRVAVLHLLAAATRPMSHTEVVESLGNTDWDPATIYRNLIKLTEAGIASVASRVDGITRYSLAREGDGDHHHAHFLCEDCGVVSCLPTGVTDSLSVEGPWETSVRRATVQLVGECPDCLTRP